MSNVKNWADITPIEAPITERLVFTGEKVMVVRNIIAPGDTVPNHKHPHEQIFAVLSGECDVVAEGRTVHLGPDGLMLFSSNVEHAVIVTGSQPLVALDIFSPIREDFLPK